MPRYATVHAVAHRLDSRPASRAAWTWWGVAAALVALFGGMGSADEPRLLDDQFRLPPGFHIYKAAPAELTGGTYDITLDGQGRLLVGDGNAVRRLTDTDNDQIYDTQEVIARGLGGRGPQGLLVHGDRLYAVGGDGIQLFSGYLKGGMLRHEGRLGQPFNTGGDHAAHTVLRGLDGYIYFVCGDGGGTEGRKHITEASSPVIHERNGSVFRFDPNGEYWECISAGGRNAPSLGMNYLGEFFSWDSDMEWHVDLPWYRPVRLNHWVVGGDQGWQSVGAYPPYYIDNAPPVLEVGRGSPNWGVFYEHTQFPAKYSNAFLCCDYRWKSATSGGYNSSGRLVSFHLRREGASWRAEMETLAEAKPNAADANGRDINFALVDVDVAPDGSILVSDHNQGVWRIFHDATSSNVPRLDAVPTSLSLTDMPQPGAEWSRQAQARLIDQQGGWGTFEESTSVASNMARLALSSDEPLRSRLSAIRYLSPDFQTLPRQHLQQLARDAAPEIRAQTAWLIGIRRTPSEIAMLLDLLSDSDAFVRRRAAEAIARNHDASCTPSLLKTLSDPSRAVRYAAMTALAHRPSDEWQEAARRSQAPNVWMRALVSAKIRHEELGDQVVLPLARRLLAANLPSSELRLDRLRVLGLYQDQLQSDQAIVRQVHELLVSGLDAESADVAWESARLAGAFQVGPAIEPLLTRLANDSTQPVTRFHLADALSRIRDGWTEPQSHRLLDWLTTTQAGWFAEFEGKGRQFPQFWATVLDRIVDRHAAALEATAGNLKPSSQLANAAYGALATSPSGQARLVELLGAMNEATRGNVIRQLARQKVHQALWPVMLQGLLASESLEGRQALADWVVRQGVRADELVNQLDEPRVDDSVQRQLAHHLLALSEHERHGEAGVRALGTLFPASKSNEPISRGPTSQLAAREHWQAWYRDRFDVPFLIQPRRKQEQMTDEALHRLILQSSDQGNASHGRTIYLQAGCFSCHGGLADKQAALFGPDLAGVTKRLQARELADAIVYPSKQVAERFRNTLVLTDNGVTSSGVLTERNQEYLVLVNQDNQVTRIESARIEAVRALDTSPMPAKLLNRFTKEQTLDLLAFLRSLN